MHPPPPPIGSAPGQGTSGDADRMAQGVRNAQGLCVLAVAHFTLAWSYGDPYQQLLFGGVAAGWLVYLQLDANAAERSSYRAGFAFNVVSALVIQAALPADLRAPALLLPFGLSLFSGATSLPAAAVSFSAVLAFAVSGEASGLLPGLASPVPVLVSVATTVTVTFAGAIQGLQSSHGRTALARALIVERQAALAVEDRRLAADRRELEAATAALERETEDFERLRARESRLAGELSAKRADERALIEAIHQDLREPLRNVVSFGQLIERRVADEPDGAAVADYLGYAVDGGRRMAAMLEDLLRYAKTSEPGEVELVDLAEVADGARRDLHDIIARTGASVDVRADALPRVYGHATQLTQLLLNLLSNGLKFARPGQPPRVEISGRPRGDGGAVVWVRDDGVGIPGHQLDKVFGLFNRAHEADGYEGSGVGLALCRRIAIAHGAELTVESAVGAGTTFSIAFAPAASPAESLAPC